MESEVANGYKIDTTVKLSSLPQELRKNFALEPNSTYRKVDTSSGKWQGIVRGGEAWEFSGANIPGQETVRSPWAVWTTDQILNVSECKIWRDRAETSELSDPNEDFIFAGSGSGDDWGLSKVHTGGRRLSETTSLNDPAFAAIMTDRLREQIPEQLVDGRRFGGVGSSFLLSKYTPGGYFAPHIDGRGSGGFSNTTSSEFTVVLYISNDFVGGGTHYLSGRLSEVKQSVELRPNLGCASVHRQGTVVHAGGAVTSGTKYIMQFFLFYNSPEVAEPREVLNLRWGV
ncbi:hypothetical protein TrVE_jg10985 [Triparma verrucosa]|uniref:Fe2OG dioxygenase domain-containing protein n=1 Tax=Triparma verrucosa TaxID=1606542 RepID=A0A9W7BT25_9STRA|nr:hypothetical protein TrVE_jg10985 [Triparma verrucosa]